MLATLAAALSVLTGPADPSLSVRTDLACVTTQTLLHEDVLDYQGVVLTWDEESLEFSLTISGTPVAIDTYEDANGWPSFAGMYQDGEPLVYGCVIPGGSGSEYSVEITRPGSLPMLLGVLHSGGDPIVVDAKKCDCSDNIDLSCTTVKCRNQSACATSYICRFTEVAVE